MEPEPVSMYTKQQFNAESTQISHPPEVGEILRQPFQRPNSWTNIDKSLKIFPMLFTVTSTAALPWDLYVFKLTQPLTVSTVQLLYTANEKGGKPDRKPYPLPYSFRNPCGEPQVWELSRLCPETSTKMYLHEFGFRSRAVELGFPTLTVRYNCVRLRR